MIPHTYHTVRIRYPLGDPLPAISVLGALAVAEKELTALVDNEGEVKLADS